MADSHVASDVKYSSVEVTSHLRIPFKNIDDPFMAPGKEGEIVFDNNKSCLMVKTNDDWKCFKALTDDEYLLAFDEEARKIARGEIVTPLGEVTIDKRAVLVDMKFRLHETDFIRQVDELKLVCKLKKYKKIKFNNYGDNKEKITEILKVSKVKYHINKNNDIVILI